MKAAPDQLQYKYLFYFHSDLAQVVEVKVLSLEEGAGLERVYHWLFLGRDDPLPTKLAFKAMETTEARQYRRFGQGELWFDAEAAQLKLQGCENPFELAVGGPDEVPAAVDDRIRAFLKQLLSFG